MEGWRSGSSPAVPWQRQRSSPASPSMFRMADGIDADTMTARRAGFYIGRGHDGRTVLILGAGNIAAIPAMDVVTKLFNEEQGLPAQDESGQRLPGPIHRGGLRGADSAGLPRGGLRGSRGGRVPGATPGDRRDPSHRLGSDVRPDRLGAAGSGAGLAEGPERAGDGQARQRRIRKRLPRAVVPGPYQRSRAGVPGGGHRRCGGDERVVPVQLTQDADHAQGWRVAGGLP